MEEIKYGTLLNRVKAAIVDFLVIMGLRIRRSKDEDRKIIFPIAIVRFILKALLGWVSLLTITLIKKKKAIHDLVAGSVVLQSTNN